MFNNLNYGFHSTELGRHNNVWNENCFCNVLNCGVGDDKIQNILWQAQNLPKCIKGFAVMLIYMYIYIYVWCIYIYIYIYIYIHITESSLPGDYNWSINQFYINKTWNETVSSIHSVLSTKAPIVFWNPEQ